MPVPAPPVDKRNFNDIVVQTEKLLQRYSPWRPAANGKEPGHALVQVFARLAEVVIDRLNQAPNKNFMAFLDLIGVEFKPPQPARVPLTFQLAAGGAADGLTPAHTLAAAAPSEGETEPVIFETERDLVLTRSQLTDVFIREPGRDLFSNRIANATGRADGAFSIFQGDRPIEHRLYVGHSKLFVINAPKTITLRIQPDDGNENESWLSAVDWTYWDGTDWTPLSTSEPIRRGGAWQINLSQAPEIAPFSVADITSNWLCGRLTTPLPRGELTTVDADGARTDLRQSELIPDAGFADAAPLDLRKEFFPFGHVAPASDFYISSDVALSKPGAAVTIRVYLDAAQPAQPRNGLGLTWEYFNGTSEEWEMLGQSSANSISLTESLFDFEDNTWAFTRNGAIKFRCPGNWTSSDVHLNTGCWLRARIDAGDYGPTSDYNPPLVQRLHIAYQWPLPRIDTIQTQVEIHRSGMLPDLAFTNQLAVDPTKDFFPFGEKPKISDTLYIACKEPFCKPKAGVTLHVTLTHSSARPPEPSKDLELIWEFWDSEDSRWRSFGESGPGVEENLAINETYEFHDNTGAFNKDGDVSFRCPPTSGFCEVNGHSNCWIRVRIASGNYGVEARYEPVTDPETGRVIIDKETGLPSYQLIPATFRPPSISSIRIAYQYTSPFTTLDQVQSENDFIFEDHREAAQAGGQWFNPFRPTSETQSALFLGFQRPGSETGFANRPTTLYFSVAKALYGNSPTDGRAAAEPAGVVWEYWNGNRWASLGARDETQNFARRGLVSFIGPPDFRASREFGRKAFWLRARWDRGEYSVPPLLHRILTNTMWARNCTTILNEILGSSNGEPDQVFRTAQSPVLPGQRIEVREPEPPSSAEREIIEAEEGENAISSVFAPGGGVGDVWVRWRQVIDFYESGPRSRHYTLDRSTGEIRFGDGKAGLTPPQGRGNIRVGFYQTGGGVRGNRPAGVITQLKSALPYVESVVNWEPAAGGSDRETLKALQDRGPKTLRHRGRAATKVDFGDLAFEASTDVARAKTIAAFDSENAGNVGLIIVPRSAGPQPVPSFELLGRVENYIEARMPPTVDLWTAGPDWLQVKVTVEVATILLESATEVQAAVLAGLAAFLHPLTGGLDGKGWAFGRKPYRSDVHALVERTPGVDHVRRLVVEEEGDVRPERFLIYSGDHEITVTGVSTF